MKIQLQAYFSNRFTMKLTKLISFAAATAVTLSVAFASSGSRMDASDIVDTAVSAGKFKTLVSALKAAGLVDALKGKGPLTVFAPTDDAFAKLEKSKPGTISALLKPENKSKLTAILTYHVVPGQILASDVLKLKNRTKVKTLNGDSITVHNKHGVRIDKANVIKTDIICTNGVIHVIDSVLLPK
jgi:uncharacterized surface protein with fasciclin (FAS1) repeats